MTIQSVGLSNTFNEFRETTNLVIDEVNKLGDGTATLVIDTITANTFVGVTSDLNVSADTGSDVVSLTTDTLKFSGANGIITSIASSSNNVVVSLDTTANVTFNDLIVSGNLTVSGTQTIINTEVIELADNKIVLNSNHVGAPTQDAGLIVNRGGGSNANAEFTWDETNDRWSTDTFNFSTNTVYANTVYANDVYANNLPTLITVSTGSNNMLYLLEDPNYNGNTAPSVDVDDEFGRVLAITDSYLVSLAHAENVYSEGDELGLIYIFDIKTGKKLRTIFPGTYNGYQIKFKYARITVSGDYIFFAPITGSVTNVVLIYSISSGEMIDAIHDPARYTTDGSSFGGIIADSVVPIKAVVYDSANNVLIVGAPDARSPTTGIYGYGIVYAFDLSSKEILWQIENPNAEGDDWIDYFGNTIALSGNTLVISATEEDSATGTGVGVIYIFDYTTRALLHTIYKPDPEQNYQYFGWSGVDTNGTYVASAVRNATPGVGSKDIYIFDAVTGEVVRTFLPYVSASPYKIYGDYIAVLTAARRITLYELSTGNVVNTFELTTDDTGDSTIFTFDISQYYIAASVPFYPDTSNGFAQADRGRVFVWQWNDIKKTSISQIDDVQKIDFNFGKSINKSSTFFDAPVTNVKSKGSVLYSKSSANAVSGNTNFFGESISATNKYFISTDRGFYNNKVRLYDIASGELIHNFDVDVNDPASSNNYFSTDINDKYIAIGNRGINSESGNVYVYSTETKSLLVTITNPNNYGTTVGDRFGTNLKLSDEILVIGGSREDTAANTDTGIIYVYGAANGTLIHTISNPEPASDSDEFGSVFDVDGNNLVVGVSSKFGGSGNTYVYNVSSNTLLYTIGNPNAFDTPTNDFFGASVSITGNTVVVGAPQEDTSLTANNVTGKAYVYSLANNQANLVFTLSNPNSVSSNNDTVDFFGTSVATTPKYIIVSAPGERDVYSSSLVINRGRIYVFESDTGTLVNSIVGPNPNTSYGQSDFFGSNLIATEKYVIATTPSEQSADSANGYVHVLNLEDYKTINPNAIANVESISLAGGGYISSTVVRADRFIGDGSSLTNLNLPTGLTSGSTSTGYLQYNGTTSASGQLDGGTTNPSGTTRLNYGGYFYPTYINLIGSVDTATAATHYFVEIGSDGFVRPKTLANVKTEVVTAAAVYSVGVTSGTATQSFVAYNSTTATAGRFDGGTTAPSATTRLNYGGNFYATNIITSNSNKLSNIAEFSSATATTTSIVSTALITFAASSYGSSKVFIQATQGVNRQTTELLVVHDGSTASATEYATQFTGSRLFNTEVDINSGNVRVLVSTTSATSTVYKAQYTLLTA